MTDATSDSRLFSFNSDQADKYYNSTFYSDVQFSVNNVIVNIGDAVSVYVSVENALFTNSWYNVDVFNNRLTISYQIDLTHGYIFDIILAKKDLGNYDAYSLATLLNEYILAAATAQSVNWTPPQFTIQFNNFSNRFSVQWETLNEGKTIEILTTTNMYDTLGINVDTGTDDFFFNDSSDYTFTYVADLLGATSYIVQCNQLPTQNYSTEVKGNFLVNLPVDGQNFGVTNWTNNGTQEFLIPTGSLVDTLEFQIKDQHGRLINFNGIPWQLLLRITYNRTKIPVYQSLTDYLEKINSGRPEYVENDNL